MLHASCPKTTSLALSVHTGMFCLPGKSDDFRSTGMGCFFFLKKLLPV